MELDKIKDLDAEQIRMVVSIVETAAAEMRGRADPVAMFSLGAQAVATMLALGPDELGEHLDLTTVASALLGSAVSSPVRPDPVTQAFTQQNMELYTAATENPAATEVFRAMSGLLHVNAPRVNADGWV